MGRSVLPHPDAVVTAYVSWEEDYLSICQFCDAEVKNDMGDWIDPYADDGGKVCTVRLTELINENGGLWYPEAEDEARHEGWEYDSDNFTNDLEAISEHMRELWPSLIETDRWVGNEVRVFLENALVEVSVSEYCGLVALCVAPRSDYDWPFEDSMRGLGIRWAKQIEEKFLSTFGAYAKVGTFSNGEAVYTKE